MGAQWCESFQVYPSVANMLQGVWAEIDSNWSINTGNPASGTQGMYMPTPGGGVGPPFMRRVFNQPLASAGVALRFWIDKLPALESGGLGGVLPILVFCDVANNVVVSFVIGTNGAIVAYGGGYGTVGPAGTLLDRSLPCVVAGAYNHIEAFVTPGSSSSGAFEVRINGVTVLNFTGDTIAHAEIGQVRIGGPGGGGGNMATSATYFGDLHAWDLLATPGPQSFVGNASVLTRSLTADTAKAGWTLSTGSVGYTLLEDNLDTTYIEADTVGLESAFSAAALPSEAIGVIYQQVNFRAIKTDAGDCDVTPGIVSGGVTGFATAAAILSTGEAWYWGVVADDPATSGLPFTVAAANASQLLLERTL